MEGEAWLVSTDAPILITGASGFVGAKVVSNLLYRGFTNLRCFVRTGNGLRGCGESEDRGAESRVQVVRGNLLSREDCAEAVRGAQLVYHLAAGRGEKSYADAFMNSAVTTRNLLEALARDGAVRRLVNISSFAVYSNRKKARSRVLDETCPIETESWRRGEAYCFGKAEQDAIVEEFGKCKGIPCVTVRPGYVIGPGKSAISGRVGIDSFGVFLHLGGSNKIPFTYVDNCADAIVLAGLKTGIDGEVFNVVDDGIPSSRRFLRMYKRHVKSFRSVYVPHTFSYVLCYLWEAYSKWSNGQLPLAFNRRRWHAYWKKTRYSNEKLKKLTGWAPKVSMDEALKRFYEGCRNGKTHA